MSGGGKGGYQVHAAKPKLEETFVARSEDGNGFAYLDEKEHRPARVVENHYRPRRSQAVSYDSVAAFGVGAMLGSMWSD